MYVHVTSILIQLPAVLVIRKLRR